MTQRHEEMKEIWKKSGMKERRNNETGHERFQQRKKETGRYYRNE